MFLCYGVVSDAMLFVLASMSGSYPPSLNYVLAAVQAPRGRARARALRATVTSPLRARGGGGRGDPRGRAAAPVAIVSTTGARNVSRRLVRALLLVENAPNPYATRHL